MAAPTFQQIAITSTAVDVLIGGTATATLAAAPVAGALLVLALVAQGAGGIAGTNSSTPDGWTLLGHDETGTGRTNLFFFYRISRGALDQSVTVTNNGVTIWTNTIMHLSEYRGLGTVPHVDFALVKNTDSLGDGTLPTTNFGAGPRAIIGVCGVDGLGVNPSVGAPGAARAITDQNVRLFSSDLLRDGAAGSTTWKFFNTGLHPKWTYGVSFAPGVGAGFVGDPGGQVW